MAMGLLPPASSQAACPRRGPPGACDNSRPMQRTSDLRIENYKPLLPPAIVLEELPLGDRASETVTRGRQEVSRILRGDDDRLVVVVGPCSIHDPDAGLEYGRRLKQLAAQHA